MALNNLNKNRITTLLVLVGIAIAGIVILQIIGLRDSYRINREQTETKIRQAFNDGLEDYKDSVAKKVRHNLKELVELDTAFYTQYRKLANGDNIGYGRKHTPYYMWHISPKEANVFKINRKGYLIQNIDSLNLENLNVRYSAYVGDVYGGDTTRLSNIAGLVQDGFFNMQDDTAAMVKAVQHRLAQNNINYKGVLRGFSTDVIGEIAFRNKIEQLNLKGDSLRISKLLFDATTDADYSRIKVATFSIKVPLAYTIKTMLVSIIGSTLMMLFIAFYLSYLLYLFMKQKKLSDIKTDFISNISHELKTPIATVQAAIQGMQHFDILNDEAKTQRYLETAATELQRLAAMVNQILSVSVFENEQFVINPVVFDLEQAIRQIIDSQTFTQQKEVSIVLYYTAPAEIVGDKNYLTQVMSNLVDNAVKYSGENVNILITCTSVSNGIGIEVQDNGPGIPEAYQSQIFQKFFRVPGTDAHIKGQGLGLNFVQKIMEKHGGEIKLARSGPNGTCFYLFLPQ